MRSRRLIRNACVEADTDEVEYKRVEAEKVDEERKRVDAETDEVERKRVDAKRGETERQRTELDRKKVLLYYYTREKVRKLEVMLPVSRIQTKRKEILENEERTIYLHCDYIILH